MASARRLARCEGRGCRHGAEGTGDWGHDGRSGGGGTGLELALGEGDADNVREVALGVAEEEVHEVVGLAALRERLSEPVPRDWRVLRDMSDESESHSLTAFKRGCSLARVEPLHHQRKPCPSFIVPYLWGSGAGVALGG